MKYKLYLFDQVGTMMPTSFLLELQEKLLDVADEIAKEVPETADEVREAIQESERIKNTYGKDDPRFRRYLVFEEIGGLILYKSKKVQMELFPDAQETCEKIKEDGATLAVFASGAVEYLKASYDSVAMTDWIDGFFTQQEIGSKYDPKTYEKIASKMGVSVDEMVFITDRMDEVEGAMKAGVFCYLANHGAKQEEKEGYTVIGSLSQVIE